jgi:hypothetical protein
LQSLEETLLAPTLFDAYRKTRLFAVLFAAALVLTACGSSSNSSPTAASTAHAASSPGATSAAGTPTPSAAQASTIKCPSASVVASATGKNVSGPTGGITNSVGPESTTVCGYPISGGGPDSQVTITYIAYTMDALMSSAKSLAAEGKNAVSGLGDAAYEEPDALYVFTGSTQIAINAPGSSSTQLEALARAILGS